MGELIEGAMQQAPQCFLHSIIMPFSMDCKNNHPSQHGNKPSSFLSLLNHCFTSTRQPVRASLNTIRALHTDGHKPAQSFLTTAIDDLPVRPAHSFKPRTYQ